MYDTAQKAQLSQNFYLVFKKSVFLDFIKLI